MQPCFVARFVRNRMYFHGVCPAGDIVGMLDSSGRLEVKYKYNYSRNGIC